MMNTDEKERAIIYSQIIKTAGSMVMLAQPIQVKEHDDGELTTVAVIPIEIIVELKNLIDKLDPKIMETLREQMEESIKRLNSEEKGELIVPENSESTIITP